MGLKSLFEKYVLPKKTDFVGALQHQSAITYAVVNDLYDCFIHLDERACEMILNDEHQAVEMKAKNMNELMNAFITPIDRESIYRAVNGLNWIVLSIKHFVLETKTYAINDLSEHEKIIRLIVEAGKELNEGFEALGKDKNDEIGQKVEQVRIKYDAIVNAYVQEMAILSKDEDFKKLFIYKEVLSQLREIGKRIYMTANTLQDIVVKMD